MLDKLVNLFLFFFSVFFFVRVCVRACVCVCVGVEGEFEKKNFKKIITLR